MAVTFSNTNKPLNPRGQDASPLAYNRAALYSGKALSFDGSNDSVNLDGFTMSGDTGTFCFYADIDNDAYVFDMSPNRLVFLHNETSGQGIRVFNSTGWSNYGLVDRVGVLFYTIVCDGTSQSVFVNGQQVGDTQTIGSALNISSATKVKLGSNYINTGTYLNGQIAGFKLFNTALTAAQIADLYNFPEKIVPTGVANTALKLWLPMMETTGTTAYDGSGNGNHGTIAGATYVNGVGAAVAQTSVIDWNKGTNLFLYSEDLGDSQWFKPTGIAYAVDQTISPDGLTTADKIIEAATTGDHIIYGAHTTSTYTDYTASIYMKDNTRGFGFVQIAPNAADSTKRYTIVVDLSDGSVTDTAGNSTGASYNVSDAGNGWYRISVTRPHGSGSSVFIVYGLSDSGTPTYDSEFEPTYTGDGTSSLYVWGASLTASLAVTPYIPTLATTQPTPVLLPAGLTTGRDITGVNLFENVRKQGALNLDGQSWADIHDNESLDMTDAISAECWVYWRQTTASNDSGLLSRWDGTTGRQFLIYHNTTTSVQFYIDNANSQYQSMTEGWHHIVGTYDKVNRKIYVDGVLRDTDAQTTSIPSSDDKIEIGRYSHTASKSTEDTIAQPRIYNRALTNEEIQRNYNAGKNIYS